MLWLGPQPPIPDPFLKRTEPPARGQNGEEGNPEAEDRGGEDDLPARHVRGVLLLPTRILGGLR